MSEKKNDGPSEGASNGYGDLASGSLFNYRYTVQRTISRGLCAVYAATDNETGKDVALKLIPNISRFESVILHTNSMRAVDHPNLAQIYDVGTSDGYCFIAMELIEGQSLYEYLRSIASSGTDLATPVAARIISEILIGLEAAHEGQVTDTDLKPTRVTLTSEPNADEAPLKLTDLGTTARALGICDPSRNLRYAAPEIRCGRLMGEPASDVYSVSVIFYEMLTQVYPFGEWRSPSQARDDVPNSTSDLISRGLSARMSLRPQSAKDYRKELFRPKQQVRGGDGLASKLLRIFRRP